jgi:uncharacterized protein YidB (DUF937 family)
VGGCLINCRSACCFLGCRSSSVRVRSGYSFGCQDEKNGYGILGKWVNGILGRGNRKFGIGSLQDRIRAHGSEQELACWPWS